MIQAAIQGLLDGRDLRRDEAREVMGEIIASEATPGQIGGFLVALRVKGETADEIAGCAEAMRGRLLPVRPAWADLVDLVGTGGDGARTFNISTTAAIVASSFSFAPCLTAEHVSGPAAESEESRRPESAPYECVGSGTTPAARAVAPPT